MIKKKIKIDKLLVAHLYINCALKNTILSLTNEKGQLYKQWSSKSLKKTSNLKKNSPYNIHFISYKVKKFLISKKIYCLKLFIKGRGPGRYNVIKNLISKKIKILFIQDNTNLPFNGCRSPKQKRR
uniref:Ribosomal protein S11 n=1 Tax=Thraustotheca clavata TaxID=74557 RepID=S5TRT7_9STRA|nr:ribosomal protein S11 [Thraustotheca clavata]AGS55527.1 ribosomal protein S11 [Thraustotheca clavata]